MCMYVYMFIHMSVYIQTQRVQLVLATAASVTQSGLELLIMNMLTTAKPLGNSSLSPHFL